MPGVTTPIGAFWVYVLESLKDGKRYIGFTTDLKARLRTHSLGASFATKSRLPMKLIYAEVCPVLQLYQCTLSTVHIRYVI